MDIEGQIIQFAKQHKKFSVLDFLKSIDHRLTRPYVSKIVGELVMQKKLVRAGESYRTCYSLPENISSLGNIVSFRIKNEDLHEHKVLEKIIVKAPFVLRLKDNIRSIFDYAFSEMLNNAIEHSKSKYIKIEISKRDGLLTFVVQDFGIGVFRNVMRKRKLNNEFEAMQDLLKGKTTTAPQAHSGEGIFFTSKAATIFYLDSYGYELIVDNNVNDVFFRQNKKGLKGTKVVFSIELKSNKHLIDIFGKYQTDKDEFGFDKTEIQIKLFTSGTVHVSRSQARRVLSGLENFKTVVLDFDKVPMIGQAFADEIFRVFKNRYPEIMLVPINMNEAVEFMVKRVGS